ncbi:mitochondrial fission ELM1 family protein [Oleispirillum naphthae]|uniref:mitochondrial fission ELM1 family protein n=1 Tax=Oleispirillum naphthae TaxID=2838853 RepID=UPI0030826608
MDEIWALLDDRAGNTAQTLGVAEALGQPFVEKRIAYTALAGLPNLIRGKGLAGVAEREGLRAPWPRLVIASGRRLAPVARWIKAQSGAKGRACALCQIMDPGWPGRRGFDLIAVPTHDLHAPAGGNILRIPGAPHRVTAARLAAARAAWAQRIVPIPAPRIAVLVGGATKSLPFTAGRAAALGRAVAVLADEMGGRVMLTTSRRTGREAEDALIAELPQNAWTYRWGDSGENPYFGLLAWADAVVVTGDSMSMVSEACGTEVPVLIDAPEAETSAKHARLHADLIARGRALPLAAAGPQALARLSCRPLNAAVEVAAAIRAKNLI